MKKKKGVVQGGGGTIYGKLPSEKGEGEMKRGASANNSRRRVPGVRKKGGTHKNGGE